MVLVAVIGVAALGASTVALMTNRRGERSEPGVVTMPTTGRAPIVIELPRGAQMRLVREQRLSYALEVDDTVRITGINLGQMAKVAASLVDARSSSGSGGPT